MHELEIDVLAREIAQGGLAGSQTVPERPPVGEFQIHGVVGQFLGLVGGQAGILKDALEAPIGTKVHLDSRISCLEAFLRNRCDVGSNGETPIQ